MSVIEGQTFTMGQISGLYIKMKTTDVKQYQNKKTQATETIVGTFRYHFDDKYQYFEIYHNDKKAMSTKSKYYLSDTKEDTFDESKWGAATSGKYIISISSDSARVSVMEILMLNENEIKVNIGNKEHIGEVLNSVN